MGDGFREGVGVDVGGIHMPACEGAFEVTQVRLNENV
jgi:hypothetical protein